MKYEVKRGPVVLAYTEDERCVDDRDKMLALIKAGHALYVDGRRLAKERIPAVCDKDGAFSHKKFLSLKGKD